MTRRINNLKSEYVLEARRPAKQWEEAYPLGNGRLGAMVYGGGEVERLQINVDDLWTGGPRQDEVDIVDSDLDQARALVFSDQLLEAEQWIHQRLLGADNEAFTTVGEVLLEHLDVPDLGQYRRQLDLETGLLSTQFSDRGCHVTRYCFASAPADLIVMYVSVSEARRLGFDLRLTSPHPTERDVHVSADRSWGQALLYGRVPRHQTPMHLRDPRPLQYETTRDGQALRFCLAVRIIPIGGRLLDLGQALQVRDAHGALLFISAASTFRDRRYAGRHTVAEAQAWALAAFDSLPNITKRTDMKQLFDSLFAAARDDTQRQMAGCRIALSDSTSAAEHLDLEARLTRVADGGDDHGLISLATRYASYLMQACSRPEHRPPAYKASGTRTVGRPGMRRIRPISISR